MLQKKLAEKQPAHGPARAGQDAEQMNKAMAQLNETVGADVPTFHEIRDKIPRKRYAKATGTAELAESESSSSACSRSAGRAEHRASARLAEIRAPARSAAGTVSDAIPQIAAEPEQAGPLRA